jgi:uncharacterized repeat protein (TIGR01451 family)
MIFERVNNRFEKTASARLTFRRDLFLCLPLVFLFCLLVFSRFASAALVCSTPGKDGAGTPAGVVNTYYPATASASAGATSISLGASSGAATAIASGDLLLVIQMQDADIRSSNNSNYGSGTGTGTGYTSLNQAGLYEFVKATNAVGTGGGSVTLATGLANSYRRRLATATNGQSTFQVVRVPQYTTATVSGTLSAAPWDGTKGGIVAIDVAGALTINGIVEADGKGFRGGWGERSNTTGLDTDYCTLDTVLGNGTKGEGIAGSPTRMNATFNTDTPTLATSGTSLGYPNGASTNATKGRGAPGNGGGGGTDGEAANDENSGGGGGGNYSHGGKGGNSWRSNQDVGGEGGASVPASYDRIVMGGGGGAGTSNDGTADSLGLYTNPAGNPCNATAGACSSGAPGGGIIIFRARSISGGGAINARGGTAYNTQNDSAGGGGAGGSVVLETQLGGNIAVNVSGGDGGNAWRNHSAIDADRHGPGGGGSGGFIAYSPAGLNLSATLTGGLNGRTTNEATYGSSSSSGGIYAYQSPNIPGSEPGYICQPSLSIAKSTTTPVINASGTTTYKITVKNTGVAQAKGVSISDLLPGSPAHFTYVSTLTLTYTPAACATRTTTDPDSGSSTPTWSLWDIDAGCQLDLTFNVSVPAGTIPATYQNPASATYNGVTITYNPLSSTAEDVTVRAPVSAAKSFSPASIASGGQSTVTFTLTNSNPVAITAVGFTDTLPAAAGGAPGNMTIANPPAPSTTCVGAPVYTAVNGSGSFIVSGLTVPAGSSCNVSFTVTAVQAGIYVNTLPAGGISGSTGASTAPATASLTVANPILPPTIAKTFLTNPILPGGTTTLRFSLTNPNAGTAIGSAGFTDSLPNNITVAPTPNISNSCGGTVTAVAGSAFISLNTNGTIPAGSNCTLSLDVTGSTPGIYQNTTGQVEGDTGTGNQASASLTIMAPPVVEKTFLTNPVQRGAATTLRIILSNPNNFTVTGAAFLDTYPSGLINATPANPLVSCTGGGSATQQGGSNGGSTIGISAGSIAAGNSCTVTVSVQAAIEGLYTNYTGTVTTTNAGISAAVTAGLNVLAPPVVTKSFSPAQVAAGGSTTMTINVENPAANTASLTGVTLLDNYPAGMTNATAGSAPVCTTGGSANLTTGTGVSGGSSVGLDTGVIPPGGFCTITQQVTTTQDATNTTNAPTSTNGDNGTAASAFLKLLKPIVVSKSFSNFHPGAGTTDVTMTIAILNPNPIAATAVAFTDTYPASMTNSPNNPASPSNPGNNCGPSALETYTSGGGNLVLANGQIPPNSTCTVTQLVRFGANNTSYSNTVTVNTGNMGSDSDTSIVTRGSSNAVPYFTKIFAPNSILPGGTSTLTFTLTNPHSAAISTIAFTDTLPSGLTATNIGATAAGTCPGTYTITGGNLITYTSGAATLATGASCTFGISTITSGTPGIYINTTSNISASSGTGGPAEASLAVAYPPTISKSFSDTTIVSGGTTAMTIRLGNLNAFPLTTSSALTDTLPTTPGAMTIANGTVSNNTCPFTPLDQLSGALTAGDTAVRIPNLSSIPTGGCEFTVYVTASTAGTYTNTIGAGALTTSNAGNSAAATSASLNVVAVRPTVSKAFLPATIAAGGTSTLQVTLYNPNSVPIALSSTFTDPFPTGVVTAGTPSYATTCIGGAVGGTSGTLTLSSGASIPPGTYANPGSCTLQVDITAAATGVYTNTIAAGALQTNAGNNAAAATAVLTVPASTPPTVSKSFGTIISITGITTTLTITLGNTNPASATLTANLNDNLPANLVIATPNGLTGSCTLGLVTATSGTGLVRYASGATIPAGGCTIVVNVTSAIPGTYTNTIAAGALQTNLGNSPGPTSDTITIAGPPALTVLKQVSSDGGTNFSTPAPVNPGGTLTYRVTVTNSGSGDATNVVITDPIPTYTTYVAGSAKRATGSPGLTYGAAPITLTDSADGDGFDFGITTPGVVTYGVGTIAPGAANAVQLFLRVTVN